MRRDPVVIDIRVAIGVTGHRTNGEKISFLTYVIEINKAVRPDRLRGITATVGLGTSPARVTAAPNLDTDLISTLFGSAFDSREIIFIKSSDDSRFKPSSNTPSLGTTSRRSLMRIHPPESLPNHWPG